LRDMVRTLFEFEGARCLWRVLVAAATLLLLRGMPVVAAVVIALVTVNGRVAQAAVSAVIALVFDGLGRRLRARPPWRAALANRLWTYEKPAPATEVQILLRSAEVRTAKTALRRAKFNPQVYGLRLGTPPADAPDLDYKIAVNEPEAWSQSASDEDRTQRIVAVLEAAGIRARASGIDVLFAEDETTNLESRRPGRWSREGSAAAGHPPEA